MGTGTVRWSEDEESLFHNGEQIAIEDFKRGAFSLIAETEDLINELFGGQWDSIGPAIDMTRISDSLVLMGAGESFATAKKNQWLEPGFQKVIRTISQSVYDKKRACWKKDGIKKWLHKLRMFRESDLYPPSRGRSVRGPFLLEIRLGTKLAFSAHHPPTTNNDRLKIILEDSQ